MEKHNNIKGILFDKDGTLLEFSKTWQPIANQVVTALRKHYALPDSYQSKLEQSIGLYGLEIHMESSLSAGTNRDVALDFHKILHWIDSEELIKISTYYFNTIAANAPIYLVEGVKALFKALKRKQLLIGLSTADSFENATVFLEKTGLIECTDFIGADDGIIEPKPAPDYMIKFCETFKIAPEEVVVIGDTMTDMNFALNSHAALKIGVLTGTGTKEDIGRVANYLLPSVTSILTDDQLVWEK